MLSRTADNLYWLARYVERAEYLARIGTLKQKPSDWKDYFFPELHAEKGS